MKRYYRSNYKYIVFLYGCTGFILLSIAIYISNFPVKRLSYNLLLFFPILVFYFLWITPKKITIDEDNFLVQNFFRIRLLQYSDIQKITISYSSKSLIWYGGNTKKAHMLCFIKLSSIPLDLIMVNNSINNYHELCDLLLEKTERGQKRRSSQAN